MLAEQFRAAAATANLDQLDALVRRAAQAWGSGEIDDADYQVVIEAAQVRRAAVRRPPAGVRVAAAFSARARSLRPRSPDKIASRERRRRCAASGSIPAKLAAHFTQAETAALSIIAAEIRARGECTLALDAIAAKAGVSRTTTQNAVREAVRLGLMARIERPIPGRRSQTNILRIISPEWSLWLRHERVAPGFKSLSPTNNSYFSMADRASKSHPTRPSAAGLGYRDEADTAHGRRPRAASRADW